MKKTLTALLCALTLSSGMAQVTLTSADCLRRAKGDAAPTDTAAAPAPRRALSEPLEGSNYYNMSSSPVDQYGNTDWTAGLYSYYGNAAKVELPADGASGQATITGLYDMGAKADVSTLYPIKAQYDAEAGTITIRTPYDPANLVAKGTRIADYTVGSLPYQGIILGCRIGDAPDLATGQIPIYIQDNIVFTLTDTGSFVADGSWLTYAVGDEAQGIDRIFTGTELYEQVDGAKMVCLPHEISFDGETAMVGVSQKTTFLVANIGRGWCDTQFNVTGAEELGLQVAAVPTLAPAGSGTCYASINPTKEGQWHGRIQMRAADTDSGLDDEITVTADITGPTDYQKVVKEGDFTFTPETMSYGEVYPYVINTEKFGYPVAMSTNPGEGVSGVDVSFAVPEGQVGTLTFSGIHNSRSPNGFYVWLDQERLLLMNTYDYFDAGEYHYDVTNAIEAGEHTMQMNYWTQIDWYNSGSEDEPAYGCWHDLALTLKPQEANDAVLLTPDADFGPLYCDRLEAQGNSTATLLNRGTEPLGATGCKGEHFTLIPTDATAQFGEKLPLSLSFRAAEPGDYAEDLVISTTAGDFTVHCTAAVEKIATDYNVIVDKGDFSFDTSHVYPWKVDADTKSASNTNQPTVGHSPTYSWLEARFVVPEGSAGTISWDAMNDSEPITSFMEDEIFTNGTEIFCDGVSIARFGGTQTPCGSVDCPEEALRFEAGEHSVRFQFQNKVPSETANTVTLSNLALNLADSSAISIENAASAPAVYYNLQGQRVAAPGQGVYIKVQNGQAAKIMK